MNPGMESQRSISQILRSLGPSTDLDSRKRRRFARRPVNVRVLIDGTSCGVAWALNLSGGGIRVIGEQTLSVGEMVRLRIDGDTPGPELGGFGRVVWVKKLRDGFVSGIEFAEPL